MMMIDMMMMMMTPASFDICGSRHFAKLWRATGFWDCLCSYCTCLQYTWGKATVHVHVWGKITVQCVWGKATVHLHVWGKATLHVHMWGKATTVHMGESFRAVSWPLVCCLLPTSAHPDLRQTASLLATSAQADSPVGLAIYKSSWQLVNWSSRSLALVPVHCQWCSEGSLNVEPDFRSHVSGWP